MEATKMNQFEGHEFAIQVIAKGAFVDSGSSHKLAYMVETTTIRLNPVAMNDWSVSCMHSVRECYGDGPEGDAAWEAQKNESAERSRVWKTQIIESLGIDRRKCSVCITQALAEIFTVVHIWEIETPT